MSEPPKHSTPVEMSPWARMAPTLIATGGAAAVVAVLVWSGMAGNQSERADGAEVRAEAAKVKADLGMDLAAEVERRCRLGGTQAAELGALCVKAREVVEVSAAPPNGAGEIDDPERQDPEMQDPETQDSETQDPDPNDPERDDPEVDDSDPDDPEVQDPETQDPEVQDPEIDDPPATGPPGPACPPGYEQRPAVITNPDGSTQPGVACVQAGAPTTTADPTPVIGRR